MGRAKPLSIEERGKIMSFKECGVFQPVVYNTNIRLACMITRSKYY